MTSGHSHMKLAQLCEDKGEACAGHRPSTSIWVLSSLGPGGTWDHTSRGGPAGIYCPLMVCAVQCRIHEARLHYRSAAVCKYFSTSERTMRTTKWKDCTQDCPPTAEPKQQLLEYYKYHETALHVDVLPSSFVMHHCRGHWFINKREVKIFHMSKHRVTFKLFICHTNLWEWISI